MSMRLRLLLTLVLSAPAWALECGRPFGDFMVLPHGAPCQVWGTAKAGAAVELSFAGQRVRARCDAQGAWRVTLQPLQPHTAGRDLTISSGDATVTLREVLVGEVWLCSGQSNMDFPLSRAVGGKAEAATAGESTTIRLLNLTGVPTDNRKYSATELSRLTRDRHFVGNWAKAAESSAAQISAVAWWAAKSVHCQRHIPIGIVENAVGGSGAEAWLPRETLAARQESRSLLDDGWLGSPRIGPWARGRARHNLGSNTTANHPFRPSFLFESGVRWWRGFPFTRVLWYQGESNAEIADDRWNEQLIVDLVTGWRGALAQPQLPFFMVQLPRIGGSDPLRAHWPQFREVQSRAVKRLAHAHLIVTRDLGWDSPDVHPPDKRPVAERLAKSILENRSGPATPP